MTNNYGSPCPTCGVAAHQPCRARGSRRVTDTHAARPRHRCPDAESCEACGTTLCDTHHVGEYLWGCDHRVLCADCHDHCPPCAREAGLDRAADETLGVWQEGT